MNYVIKKMHELVQSDEFSQKMTNILKILDFSQ
jgi:hypothetical protein